jgi:pfkB family carbohydrate kinase
LYEFRYTHPLSEPLLSPSPPKPVQYANAVRDTTVLVYGMLEGLPLVKAERVIYDPQSESANVPPTEFTRSVGQLALVLNEREVRGLSGASDIIRAARRLIKKYNAKVVVVKQGPYGCVVVEPSSHARIPVFPSTNVFKIGSGDVFSAAFAKFWALDRMPPAAAAEQASRCAALYCDTRTLDAVASLSDASLVEARKRRRPKVYLAGPFFSLSLSAS